MYEFDSNRFKILEEVYSDYRIDTLDTQFRLIKQFTEEMDNLSNDSEKYLSIKEDRDYMYKLIVLHMEELKQQSIQYFSVDDIKSTCRKILSEIERIDNKN